MRLSQPQQMKLAKALRQAAKNLPQLKKQRALGLANSLAKLAQIQP